MTANLRRVLRLMDRSPVHCDWSLQEKLRLAIPPLIFNQFMLNEDGFVSWAWLTDEAAQGYMTRTRKIQPDDWNQGENLWFIDLIASNPRRLLAKVRRERFATYRGTAHWTRGYGTGLVHKIGTARQ